MSKPYLNRFAKRRDANESEIIKEFEKAGFSVYRLDKPVDLLIAKDGKNHLVEVKMPGKDLNKNQQKWAKDWNGVFYVINSKEAARALSYDLTSY